MSRDARPPEGGGREAGAGPQEAPDAGRSAKLYLRKNNSPKRLIESKIARMAAVLDELQKDEWLSRHVKRSAPELVEKLEAARAAVEALNAQAEKIEEKR